MLYSKRHNQIDKEEKAVAKMSNTAVSFKGVTKTFDLKKANVDISFDIKKQEQVIEKISELLKEKQNEVNKALKEKKIFEKHLV